MVRNKIKTNYQLLPGTLKSQAAHVSSVTTAGGCNLLVKMILGYMAGIVQYLAILWCTCNIQMVNNWILSSFRLSRQFSQSVYEVLFQWFIVENIFGINPFLMSNILQNAVDL